MRTHPPALHGTAAVHCDSGVLLAHGLAPQILWQHACAVAHKGGLGFECEVMFFGDLVAYEQVGLCACLRAPQCSPLADAAWPCMAIGRAATCKCEVHVPRP